MPPCPAKRPYKRANRCRKSKADVIDKIKSGCVSEHGIKLSDAHLVSLLMSTEPSLWDALPYLSAVAKNQAGSLFLQDNLPCASKDLQAIVVGAALKDLVPLSMHQHGHSFILQVLEVATQDQKKVLGQQLSSQVELLAQDVHGCRVIQKALQVLSVDSAERLIAGLKEGIVQCMKNRHGNHVIQMCVEQMPSASIAFIIDAVETCGADQIATHMYACRVLTRLMEHVQQSKMQKALHQILQSIVRLAQDRYGNYVLQHIIEHGDMANRRRVMSEIAQCGVPVLATCRYAHNVVQKCIEVTWQPENEASLETERLALTYELLWKQGDSSFMALSRDQFGAQVVECLMDNLTGPSLEQIKQLSRNVGASWQEA